MPKTPEETTSKVHAGWVLALTSLGFFMAMMDSMIVTTASTAIREDFGVSVEQLQWTLNAYNVSIAAFLLIGVAIGNRIGHRRLYTIGLLVFVIGSAACALAPNLGVLIAARILQGIGASVMTPMSMAILSSAFPPAQRGKALGIWSGIGGLALIIGPALGGIIVSQMTWQWIFWINIPIGLIGIILSRRKLPESTFGGKLPNVVDSVLVVLASGGIVWALSESVSSGNQTPALIVGIISVLLAVAFVLRQRSSTTPMIPLTLFKSPTFSGGAIGTFLLYAAMYGVVFFLPQYFQIVNGVDALTAGLEMLPWTAMLVILSPVAGTAVDRYGERPVAIVSLLLQVIGYAWIAMVSAPGVSYWAMVVPLVISGAGISMAGPALQKAVLGAVSPAQTGIASGVFNTFRQLGGAVGTSIAVILFAVYGSTDTSATFANGFTAALIGSAVLTLIGGVSAVGLRPSTMS